MKKIDIGTKVVTPRGRKGVVRDLGQIMTGKVGRPTHIVFVQERNKAGHFVPGLKEYRPTELTPA